MGFVRLISQSFYLLTDAITYLLIPCLYGPLWAWTSLIVDAHSSLSTAFCRHLLTFTSRRFFSTSSSHRNLGLPLLLLPFGLLSHFFLTVFPCFVLTTCPIHSSLGRFTPRKKTSLPSEWEIRRNPEPVRMFCSRQEFLASSGNWTSTPLFYNLYLSYCTDCVMELSTCA